MKSKVSIVIPNFNAENYISNCIESVLNQTYENIEVIIIDDGSTDRSWNIIKEYKKIYPNIIIQQQENMNASIARNKGIDLATGDYIIFLDSDDELFNEGIEVLVNSIEENNSELAIGNFICINENEEIIGKENIVDNKINCINPMEYVGTVPNPSNKLFRLDIIKNNNIYFGNVRIGQDLNFFLKYIIYCKSISLINKNIYMWRKVNTSMTNSRNFRIFDIVENFNNINDFYIKNKKGDLYEDYIKAIQYRHYYLQMEKQKFFLKRSYRNLIVNFFSIHLKALNIKNCITYEQYKNDYKKSIIKIKFKKIYTSRLYYYLDKNFARKRK